LTNPQQVDMFGSIPEYSELKAPDTRAQLEKAYIIPPFSVLDTKQGYWQDRKKIWLSLGIKSEIGRGENLTMNHDALNFSDYDEGKRILESRKNATLFTSHSGADPAYYDKKNKVEKELGRSLTSKEFEADYYEGASGRYSSGTSIFDPVICELMYRWFCPEKGRILDPFAGGSVRGIVASVLGYEYYGIDLSQLQVEANRVQAEELNAKTCTWHIGNSVKLDEIVANNFWTDMIFSCPPYHDLEVYSKDPCDLSTMDWYKFKITYKEIIKKCVERLQPNRFACFVVSEIRNKHGNYKGFVPFTIECFRDAGMDFYNEIIVVNSVGSLALRVGNQMRYRKVGRTHQNILVFFKGDSDSIPRDFRDISQEINLSQQE
jgi:DNA modification methylase